MCLNISSPAQKLFKGTVRKALSSDADLLIKLGKSCFYEAFSDVTAPEDMQAYLASTFRRSEIEKQLNNVRAIIYIAEIVSDSAGYIYSHPAVTPKCIGDTTAIKLERLYLRKRYFGSGAGDALMQTSINAYRASGYQAVWLSSWELNDRANAFYKKWDFKVVGHQKFTVGSDIQNDLILSRKLS